MSVRPVHEIVNPVATVVLGIVMLPEAIIEIWSIAVAVLGGPYPWPLVGMRSSGLDVLAVILILLAGAAVIVLVLAAVWLVVGVPVAIVNAIRGPLAEDQPMREAGHE